MYQGANKGGGGIVGWGTGTAPSNELSVDAAEAFESSSGNEGVVCQDPNDPGTTIIAIAHLSEDDGSLQWSRALDPDEVLCRTVAMSQMTSMLRDINRNEVYDKAIKVCVENFISKTGRPPAALDIGTGTGMLAMAAARAGAQPVIAFEMFQKMASIAEEVVHANDLGEIVSVIPFKSSDIEGLPIVPDLLISELLDSALLGEAVVMAHSDAIQRFMDTSSPSGVPITDRIVPNRYKNGMLVNESLILKLLYFFRAYVFGALIESSEVRDMRTVTPIAHSTDNVTPSRSTEAENCPGGAILIPVHWTEMSERGARELSAAVKLAEFNFYQLDQPGAPFDSGVITEMHVLKDGIVHGVVMWWETKLLSKHLDPDDSISYSTSPRSGQSWQDHWVQVVFPFPGNGQEASAGDIFTISFHNDGINMWLELVGFDRAPVSAGQKRKATELYRTRSVGTQHSSTCTPPLCTCGWHLLCGKSNAHYKYICLIFVWTKGAERLQTLNDTNHSDQWRAGVNYIVNELVKYYDKKSPIRAVDLSDGSLLSLLLAKKYQAAIGADSVELAKVFNIVSLERKVLSGLFFAQLVASNGLAEVIDVVDTMDDVAYVDEGSMDAASKLFIDVVFSECFYFQLNSQPSWQAVSYYYMVNSLRPKLKPNAIIVPCKAKIMCAAVQLPDLYRSHGLVGRYDLNVSELYLFLIAN